MRQLLKFVWSEIRPRVPHEGNIAGRDVEDERAMEISTLVFNIFCPPIEVVGRFLWLVLRALAALVRAIAHRPANAAS
jgi:hypothetical protein